MNLTFGLIFGLALIASAGFYFGYKYLFRNRLSLKVTDKVAWAHREFRRAASSPQYLVTSVAFWVATVLLLIFVKINYDFSLGFNQDVIIKILAGLIAVDLINAYLLVTAERTTSSNIFTTLRDHKLVLVATICGVGLSFFVLWNTSGSTHTAVVETEIAEGVATRDIADTKDQKRQRIHRISENLAQLNDTRRKKKEARDIQARTGPNGKLSDKDIWCKAKCKEIEREIEALDRKIHLQEQALGKAESEFSNLSGTIERRVKTGKAGKELKHAFGWLAYLGMFSVFLLMQVVLFAQAGQDKYNGQVAGVRQRDLALKGNLTPKQYTQVIEGLPKHIKELRLAGMSDSNSDSPITATVNPIVTMPAKVQNDPAYRFIHDLFTEQLIQRDGGKIQFAFIYRSYTVDNNASHDSQAEFYSKLVNYINHNNSQIKIVDQTTIDGWIYRD